jgi:hypothetical protein
MAALCANIFLTDIEIALLLYLNNRGQFRCLVLLNNRGHFQCLVEFNIRGQFEPIAVQSDRGWFQYLVAVNWHFIYVFECVSS